jgi:hypothetical protein
MQTINVTNVLGASIATDQLRVLEGIIAELKTAPAEEYLEPGVSATTMIHVPAVEGEPWGKYAIEWSQEDLATYNTARLAVVASIAQATGLPEPEVKRMLVNADAFPPADVTMFEVPRLRRQLENLVKLYNAKVLGRAPNAGVVIASGIFLGAALIGVFAYAKWRDKR